METRKLIELLRATTDPNQRQQAEEMLSRVRTAKNMCFSTAHSMWSNTKIFFLFDNDDVVTPI